MDKPKEWLRFAYIDLLSCKKLLDDELLSNIVAFHTQQTIEKSLKALLVFHNHKIPKVHSLMKLFDLCNDFNLNENEDIILKLDNLYIESRYPSSFGLLPYGKPSKKDTAEFFTFASEVFDATCKILNINKESLI